MVDTPHGRSAPSSQLEPLLSHGDRGRDIPLGQMQTHPPNECGDRRMKIQSLARLSNRIQLRQRPRFLN